MNAGGKGTGQAVSLDIIYAADGTVLCLEDERIHSSHIRQFLKKANQRINGPLIRGLFASRDAALKAGTEVIEDFYNEASAKSSIYK